jgi:hypothetical protein
VACVDQPIKRPRIRTVFSRSILDHHNNPVVVAHGRNLKNSWSLIVLEDFEVVVEDFEIARMVEGQ